MQYLQIVMDDGWLSGGIIMAFFLGIVIVCAYLMVCRRRIKSLAVPICFKWIAYDALKKQCSHNSIVHRKLVRMHTKS